jgi:hypothetical protein
MGEALKIPGGVCSGNATVHPKCADGSAGILGLDSI